MCVYIYNIATFKHIFRHHLLNLPLNLFKILLIDQTRKIYLATFKKNLI